MVKIMPSEKTINLALLFDGWEEASIWSCLQGCMGGAWVDNIDHPNAAQILVGDFCFFAGNSKLVESQELVLTIPDSYNIAWMLMIPQDESWNKLIETAYENRFKKM